MAKRETAEARILRWFREAPLGEAELVLGLVKPVVNQRLEPARTQKVNKLKKVISAKLQAGQAKVKPGYTLVLQEGDGGQTTPF